MKRAEQLEKTRQSIMRTATKLFLQKGFGETSTRDIAKQVGLLSRLFTITLAIRKSSI